MSWDALQCEVIDALGLRRYGLAQPLAGAGPDAVEDAIAVPAPAARAAAAASAAQATPRAPVQVPRASRPPATPSQALDMDPLLQALWRAAGRDPREVGDALPVPGLDLNVLRHSPGAKRALWPALRALRRHPTGP